MTPELTTVGDYQLVQRLGSGGMGDVYFAVSPTADRVAVKLIKHHLVTDPTIRDRFASELESLKLVYGSRVARLENADLSADPAWLAVEYIPGLTLRQYVDDRGPLPLPIAAMIGAMLADGLAKVHQAGLLHRDLKPQNIILGPDGPKVIDFGLAVLRDRESYLTAPGEIVGTPAYMSPEQVKGERDLTLAADVYGVAATLVFALTGHGLYPSTNSWGLLLRITDPADLPDLAGVPAELKPLIGAMLAFDPTARPTLKAAQKRLLEVATAGGVSADDLRRRIRESTFDRSAELFVPPHLTDPKQDPETDTAVTTVVLPADLPEPEPTPVDPVPQVKPRPDVMWLVEKVRRQYARRPTL
ncbi:serine/threonine-protein kinase [Dactylosporangium sp. AC04546]|uniref:serine/threonine-protein kinase n=1 Tax=Dactylosporangium sp. AC04546 TaxID=2862460 RepID=UPI001EDDB88F|nr:serine/threonine-protein kinase [Dactylosporangium sp. AC04546]WVK82718.1 serine/threonine-protein kinase [Dactylosporangium sp. AC04546]